MADAGAVGDDLAMTTDSFVVKPLRFPGGSIGELAVNGTVNDLAVAGARPLALTLAMILEEGLDADDAARRGRRDRDGGRARPASRSSPATPRSSSAATPTGCTSAPPASAGATRAPRCRRSACAPATASSSPARSASTARRSCSPAASSSWRRRSSRTRARLWPAVDALLDAAGAGLRCMRDATRGGVASVLNELARASGVAMIVREAACRCDPAVAGAAEILGIDPMYVANEGKLVAFVAPEAADAALAALRAVEGCEDAAEIGEVKTEPPGMVLVADGVRRQAGDGPAGRRPAAADLLRTRGATAWPQPSSSPKQNETEAITAHVIWMTTGLSCDGDSVGMTSATNPSLEDIITGAIPGMPRVVVHNPVLAFEQGAEFMQAWYDAEAGKLDPFVLILEGSLPEREALRRRLLRRAWATTPTPASRSPPTSGSTGSRRRPPRSSRSGRAPPTAASRR